MRTTGMDNLRCFNALIVRKMPRQVGADKRCSYIWRMIYRTTLASPPMLTNTRYVLSISFQCKAVFQFYLDVFTPLAP